MIAGKQSSAEKVMTCGAKILRPKVEVAEYISGSVGKVPLTIVIVIPTKAKGSVTEIVPLSSTRGFVVTPAVNNPICPNSCGVLRTVIGIAIELARLAFCDVLASR
ncbi:hypothetical protein D3C76_1078450 [compost metagenome]